MMSTKSPIRVRSTWKRTAAMNDPPANPGYGEFDKDHPASYPQPTEAELAKGDPDAWAETPTKPPYKEGHPPANPGYDEFDKDHPAMYPKVREPLTAAKKAREAQQRKLAFRAARVAKLQLGKNASEDAVVKLGFTLMKNPKRLASLEACIAEDETLEGEGMGEDAVAEFDPGPSMGLPDDDFDPTLDLDSDMGMEPDLAPDMDDIMPLSEEEDVMVDDGIDEGIYAGAITNLDQTVRSLSASLTKSVHSMSRRLAAVEQLLKNREASNGKVASTGLAMFGLLDRNRDGKVLASEWKGSKAVFASLDRNEDGVISSKDFLAGLGLSLTPAEQTLAARVAEDTEETESSDESESDGAKEAGEMPDFIKDKIEEKEEKEEASKEAKQAKAKKPMKPASKPMKPAKGKKAAEEEELEEEASSTSNVPTASAPAIAAEETETEETETEETETDTEAGSQVSALLAGEDEESDTETDETAFYFEKSTSPLGGAEQSAINAVFGGSDLNLNPQPRKASAGPKTLGMPVRSRQASAKFPGKDRTPSVKELEALWK